MQKRDIAIISFIAAQMALLVTLRVRATYFTQSSKTITALPLSAQVVCGNHVEFLGSPRSPYILVEWGDYQCSPCAGAQPEVQSLLATHYGKLKFMFRHYPLEEVHPFAMQAALAAESARSQGKFWQAHDALYNLQGRVNASSIRAVARNFAIDTIYQHNVAAQTKIDQDRADGDKAGVEGTPTFMLCCPDGKVVRLSEPSQVEQFVR